jgi:hypothetical protein
VTGPLWDRDAVEIFFEPYADTLDRPYHHLVVDSAGNYQGDRSHLYPKLTIPNLPVPQLDRVAWKPQLEVANAKATNAWSCEIRLPYSQLALDPKAAAKQTLWRMNLHRIGPSDAARRAKTPEELRTAKRKQPPLMWAWSPVGSTSCHTPERFGYILPAVFSTPELLAEASRRCTQSDEDKAWLTPASPQSLADLDKQVETLGAKLLDERKRAAEAIRSLAFRNISLTATLLLKKVREAGARFQGENDDGVSAAARLENWLIEESEKRDEDPFPKDRDPMQ